MSDLCRGIIEPGEMTRYRELAMELEEIRESITLLIRRLKWIEEEVFPEMESKIAGLMDEKIGEIESEWKTFQTYIFELLRITKARRVMYESSQNVLIDQGLI